MKRPYLGWYFAIALVALLPAGLRMLSWRFQWFRGVDPVMAEAGRALFLHEWTPMDPLTPDGDGLGPVYNAVSCVACHDRGGLGGSGGLDHNVTLFRMRPKLDGAKPIEGVVHAHAVKGVPADNESPQPLLVDIEHSQRNTPALFGAKLINEIPERVILAQERAERLKWGGIVNSNEEKLPVGRAPRLANGKLGRFGWKAQTASLSDFVQAACANELGLGNPGQAQPRPFNLRDYQPRGLDLTLEQCNQLTAFVASLPRPAERLPDTSPAREDAAVGKKLFGAVGCADCHTPRLGSIEGLYSDLLLHRMGKELRASGSYNQPPQTLPDFPSEDGSQPDEWRTPPLWGVADSAPYMHDGRAATLERAILQHGGQGVEAAHRFACLAIAERDQLVAFLQTLRAP